MQPAEGGDAISARAEVEVVGVGEDELGADFGEMARGQTLDSRLRADRGESRRQDLAMRRAEDAGAGTAAAPVEAELEEAHSPQIQ